MPRRGARRAVTAPPQGSVGMHFQSLVDGLRFLVHPGRGAQLYPDSYTLRPPNPPPPPPQPTEHLRPRSTQRRTPTGNLGPDIPSPPIMPDGERDLPKGTEQPISEQNSIRAISRRSCFQLQHGRAAWRTAQHVAHAPPRCDMHLWCVVGSPFTGGVFHGLSVIRSDGSAFA